jgi:hypothetical protein
MHDPFTASEPAMLVHEVDGPVFERAWHAPPEERDAIECPICHQGREAARGTSTHTDRPWIRYEPCGDIVAQEVTAG